MNIALRIAAGLLALVAFGSGISKTFLPKEKLAAQPGGEWTHSVSGGFLEALGCLELLSVVGLILPAVLDIAPVMVPVTSVCWVLLLTGAMITRGRLGQVKLMAGDAAYFAIAVFVAYGRFVLEPFSS
ncbi:DoxX family protein [Nocardia aurantiaca]|uniref:DoxX family protein n=1 Tax=Nocardia aurantiaca TaxID=2675850 RepID=A0A6I3KYT8_9NOCA|nr:DoxX family protein [Nocardia aurantiaca]MTE13690.1 DoxX family protein [Nocardia aurantiaca]